MITLIAAVARNSVIGIGNDLPWHLPSEFIHFKTTTKNHRIVMGRKTWESIGSKPLPIRTNIVISSQNLKIDEGHLLFSSIEEMLEYLKENDDGDETFIIGGQKIYEQTIGIADRLLISHIDYEFEGDSFFPEISPEAWKPISRFDVWTDSYPFQIVDYSRV